MDNEGDLERARQLAAEGRLVKVPHKVLTWGEYVTLVGGVPDIVRTAF
jgi:hypothetical protein